MYNSVRSCLSAVARKVSYSAETRHLPYSQSRFRVRSHPSCSSCSRPLPFRSVQILRQCDNRHHPLRVQETRLLPWKPFHFCREAPRSKVILYPCCYQRQVCLPAPWLSDGRAEQHPCNPEDDELHLHVSWQDHTEFVQC